MDQAEVLAKRSVQIHYRWITGCFGWLPLSDLGQAEELVDGQSKSIRPDHLYTGNWLAWN